MLVTKEIIVHNEIREHVVLKAHVVVCTEKGARDNRHRQPEEAHH